MSQYSTRYSVYDREAWEMVQISSFAYSQIFLPHQQMCMKLLVPQIVQPNWNCHEVKKHYALIYKHNNSLLWDNRSKLSKVERDWGLFTCLFWQKKKQSCGNAVHLMMHSIIFVDNMQNVFRLKMNIFKMAWRQRS